MLTLLAFAVPLALYFSWPSSQWNFDGVACAAALELGQPLHFFHADHLLYGWTGYLFWNALRWFSPSVRALPALQAWTSILSAAGLAGLFRTLEERGADRVTALGVVLWICACAVVWVWSIEAQVYALGLFALAWATRSLFKAQILADDRRVAAWHALAVLGHLMNALWFFPAAYWMIGRARRRGTPWAKDLMRYAAWLSIFVVVPYMLVFSAVVWPALHTNPQSIMLWLKGSAGLGATRQWQWHSAGWRAPLMWARTTFNFFSALFWPYAGTRVTGAVAGAAAVTFAGAAAMIALAFRSSEERLRRFAGIWIAVFALFLWTWEPSTECYRLTECIPWAILITLGARHLSRPWRRGFLALMFLLTAAVTWALRIRPMHVPALNPVYAQVTQLASATPVSSIYLTSGGAPWLYLLYFTGRTAWSLHSPATPRLLERWSQAAQRPSLWVESGLFEEAPFAAWAAQFPRRPAPRQLPWTELQ